MQRLLLAIAVVALAGVFTSRARARQAPGCLHEQGETPAEAARRTAPLGFHRAAAGWNLAFAADPAAFTLTDVTDPCRFELSSTDPAVVPPRGRFGILPLDTPE